VLSVTDRAADYLSKNLTNSSLPDGSIFRFVEDAGKVRVLVDKKKTGDVVISQGENELIALDEDLATDLGNRTVDLEEDKEGLKLILL
jgi:hypothetical protein